jgi:D-proline reductase (dithiol) PrdB
LIQRVIEASGLPTISISINREYTEKVKPPRAIFLPWPFGHPLGEPYHRNQQRAVLMKAFEALYQIASPGEIVDVGWRWWRETYAPSAWQDTSNGCEVTALPLNATSGSARMSACHQEL